MSTEQILAAIGELNELSNARFKTVDQYITGLEARLNTPAMGGGDRVMSSDAIARFAAYSGRRIEDIDPEQYRDYAPAMNSYLRKGEKGAGILAAMEVGSDPAGGYFVTPDIDTKFATKLFQTSPIMANARVVTVGSDALEGINDLQEMDAAWVGETGSRDDTTTAEIGKFRIPVHEIYAQPKCTQKLLDDSAFDVEAWLLDKVSKKFSRTANAAFLTGTGVLKPRGLLTHTLSTSPDATRNWNEIQVHDVANSGAWDAYDPGDILFDCVYSLKAEYRTNAKWYMNSLTIASVRKFKDDQGKYLWTDAIAAGQPPTLLGYPVVACEDMADVAVGSLSVMFGDLMEAYTIAQRQGLRVLRDPYTSKPYVRFYSTYRVGGDVTNFEAVKILRF